MPPSTPPPPLIKQNEAPQESERWTRRRCRRSSSGPLLTVAWASYLATACSSGIAGGDCDVLFRSATPLNIATWWKTVNHVTGSVEAQGRTESEAAGGEVEAGLSLAEGYRTCSAGGEAVLTTVPPITLVEHAEGVEREQGSKEQTSSTTITLVGKEATLTALEQQAADLRQTGKPGRYQGAIVNGGADILRLACRHSTRALESLGPSSIPIARFIGQRTPPELASLVTCPGSDVFGVILGLHRLNQLFYNERTLNTLQCASLDAEGVRTRTKESGVPGFLKALQSLADCGISRPLVITSASGSWSQLLIENLMVAAAGKEGYEKFWGRLSPARFEPGEHQTRSGDVNLDPFNSALRLAYDLAPFIQVADDSGLRQRIACTDVDSSECGVFFVKGDWVVPDQPEYVKAVPFPGSEDVFVYTADVAVVTRHTEPLPNTDPMLGWLKAVSSAPVQAEYCANKHCLSVVTSRDGSTRAKTAAELFTVEGKRLQGVGGLPTYLPHESFDELDSRIAQFMEAAMAATAKASQESVVPSHEPPDSAGFTALSDYVRGEYCAILRQREAAPAGCLAPPDVQVR